MYSPLLDGGGDDEHAPAFVYDPVFTGVEENDRRRRHDSIFSILFCCVVISTVCLTVYAYSHGDPDALEQTLRARGVRAGWAYGLSHLHRDAWVVLLALALAAGLGWAWVWSLRKGTERSIVMSVTAGVGGCVGLGVYCVGVGAGSGSTRGFMAAGWTLITLGIVVGVLGSLLRRRVAFACRLFLEAGQALSSESAAGVNAGALAALVLFSGTLAWHTSLMASLFSIGGSASGSLVFWYVVFSGYWISLVVLGVYKVCVSGAVAHWYFSRAVSYLPPSEPPLRLTLRAALTTSFGSIALGSLVVTTLSVVSWMLRRARSVARAAAATRRAVGGGIGVGVGGGSEPLGARVMGVMMSCLAGTLTVVTKLAERVNRLAYIHIAMHGFSFCVASSRVLKLISRHPVDLPLVDLVTRFALFAGKALGTTAVTLVVLASLRAADAAVSGVTVLVCVLGSYIILHVWSVQIDYAVGTALVAHCEDRERSGEGGGLLVPRLAGAFGKRGGSGGRVKMPAGAGPSSAAAMGGVGMQDEDEDEVLGLATLLRDTEDENYDDDDDNNNDDSDNDDMSQHADRLEGGFGLPATAEQEQDLLQGRI